ncbi:MAG: HEPN domain-containing protein [Candidatus Hydrogenedentes bacterium]|nr:HEPN domain-containing protein [Candidatus Hydrogenedentota bacterium]
MSAQNQARLLLNKAIEDFVLLEETVSNPRITDAQFGFHAQQAVEAWIWSFGVMPDKTHNLEALSGVLMELTGREMPELDVLYELGAFAVVYRYDIFDWDEPLDRHKTLSDVASLLKRVKLILADTEEPA